jgi:hypothetical protein
MDHDMTHPGFSEELMDNIHRQIKSEARGLTPATSASVLSRVPISATDQILFRLRQQESTVPGVPTPEVLGEFADLRTELEACLTALERFGEVNPRPPGRLNEGIQSTKRLMRRTLVWYMRPLRLFHRMMIRSLQQLLGALEHQQRMLGQRALQSDFLAVGARLDDIERAICDIYEFTRSENAKKDVQARATNDAQAQATNDEILALREDLRELRAEVAVNRQQLNEAITRRLIPEQSKS